MRLFLDASVMLAAAGSPTGASRAIFDGAAASGWVLVSSHYALGEVAQNLARLPGAVTGWPGLSDRITRVGDVVSLDRPVIFTAGKDRPILFSALAWADILLTLDAADFAGLLGTTFYGLPILRPADFLQRERAAERL